MSGMIALAEALKDTKITDLKCVFRAPCNPCPPKNGSASEPCTTLRMSGLPVAAVWMTMRSVACSMERALTPLRVSLHCARGSKEAALRV